MVVGPELEDYEFLRETKKSLPLENKTGPVHDSSQLSEYMSDNNATGGDGMIVDLPRIDRKQVVQTGAVTQTL